MVHFHYTTLFENDPNYILDDIPNFQNIFTCSLQDVTVVKEKYPIEDPRSKKHYAYVIRQQFREYFELREQNGLHFYDGHHRTNIINVAADKFTTNLMNNVVLQYVHQGETILQICQTRHPIL